MALQAGEVGPQRDIAWDVGDPAVQRHRIAPRVAAEKSDGAAVGAQQAEQHANGGGLARAVRAEEAGDVTGRDRQVQPVERLGAAERLVSGRWISTARWVPPPVLARRSDVAVIVISLGRTAERNSFFVLCEKRLVHRRVGHQAVGVELQRGQHHVLGVVAQHGA